MSRDRLTRVLRSNHPPTGRTTPERKIPGVEGPRDLDLSKTETVLSRSILETEGGGLSQVQLQKDKSPVRPNRDPVFRGTPPERPQT